MHHDLDLGTLSQRDSARAYEQALPELYALERDRLATVNIDVPRTVAIVLAAWARAQPYREQIATLPGLAVARIDALETYALAAWHAHLLSQTDTQRVALRQVTDEARRAYKRMRAVLEYLVAWEFVGGAELGELTAPNGAQQLAGALRLATTLVRAHLANALAHTGVTEADLAAAEMLASRLIAAVGLRAAQPAGERTARLDERNRAFTAMLGAYEELRRGLAWVRHEEGDAAGIAPSVWKRGRQG